MLDSPPPGSAGKKFQSDRENSFPYPIRDTTGSSRQSGSLSIARQMSAHAGKASAGRAYCTK